MTTSQLLKEARVKSGKSQKEISDFFGWSTPQFVSNIERGMVALPWDRVREYCKIIKLDPNVYLNVQFNEVKQKYTNRVLRKKR